jgi:hypothetical protein
MSRHSVIGTPTLDPLHSGLRTGSYGEQGQEWPAARVHRKPDIDRARLTLVRHVDQSRITGSRLGLLRTSIRPIRLDDMLIEPKSPGDRLP